MREYEGTAYFLQHKSPSTEKWEQSNLDVFFLDSEYQSEYKCKEIGWIKFGEYCWTDETMAIRTLIGMIQKYKGLEFKMSKVHMYKKEVGSIIYKNNW